MELGVGANVWLAGWLVVWLVSVQSMVNLGEIPPQKPEATTRYEGAGATGELAN